VEASLVLRYPIRATLVDCCARAATGRAAMPPRSAMNSRRCIAALSRSVCAGNDFAPGQSPDQDRGLAKGVRHCRRMSGLGQNRSVGASSSFPLYPTKQTSTAATARSASCQQRTFTHSGRSRNYPWWIARGFVAHHCIFEVFRKVCSSGPGRCWTPSRRCGRNYHQLQRLYSRFSSQIHHPPFQNMMGIASLHPCYRPKRQGTLTAGMGAVGRNAK
jgi:hypothetical protein